MTSKVTFSLEEDTLLAECVSKHPCLFDLKHPAYKDQQVRENVWKEICVILKTKSDSKDKNKKLINEHDLLYGEIKTIIMDHQAVMKKYYGFVKIFERNLLLQIVGVSLTFIILYFCFIMNFSNEERFQSSRIFSMKIFSVIPPELAKLFGMCYLFGKIHNQKDSIIFALYSCNWTEIDIRCKQLILLTMQMNNANHKKLKFTGTKIVNLEMFFKTMRDSYSVLSVLINHIKNKSE